MLTVVLVTMSQVDEMMTGLVKQLDGHSFMAVHSAPIVPDPKVGDFWLFLDVDTKKELARMSGY